MAGAGQAHVLFALFQAGDAEVQQLGRAVRLHKDVGRLHVAMDDVVAMGIAERRADLLQNAQPVGHGELRAGADQLVQRLALHALHHNVGGSVVVAQVVNGDDIGVVEPARSAAFLVEAGQHVGVAHEALGQGLDGHLAADLLVDAAIDDAHAAAPQHVDNLVLADMGYFAALLVPRGIHVLVPPLACFKPQLRRALGRIVRFRQHIEILHQKLLGVDALHGIVLFA